MKIVERIIDKISAGPTLGSFFILGDKIYYSTMMNGLDHMALWKVIVTKSGLFDRLEYENKQDLIKAHYATDRGRVTWTGSMIGDTPDFHSSGQFVLYGTPGCAAHEDLLKRLFGLSGLDSNRLKVDWQTDSHYKVMESDKNTLKDMIKLLGGEKKLRFENMKIAEVVRDRKSRIIKKVIAKIAKKPELGTFYLIGDTVYYSTLNGGLQHIELWDKIIERLFKDASSKDRYELKKSNYGADRGRVDWGGKLLHGEPHGPGIYLLEGTDDCQKYESKIKREFGLSGLPPEKLKVVWGNSDIYMTRPKEIELVNLMLAKYKITPETTYITRGASTASALRFIRLD